jgi:two-component system LytT family response regulator
MNPPQSIAKSMSEGAPSSVVAPGAQSRPILALIVDDEPIARARIALLLKRDPQIHIIGACASVAECERLDPGAVPDLVFLDIRMPQRDGFDLLESLSARGMRPCVIFVTAYSKYAVDAYDAGAIDYLLKPFDNLRFEKALARAKVALERDRIRGDSHGSAALGLDTRVPPDRLVVSEGKRMMLIAMGTIELIQVTGKHVKIFVRQHCYLTRQSLRSVEARLDKRLFVRVHRSTIVNVEQIVALHPLLHGDSEVVLKRGTRITMSRRFRRRLQPFLEKSCGLSAAGNGCIV